MAEKKTSVFANGLIWFGAGVSLAEILTGTFFAPLGFQKGLLAILLGHVIGCAMLFLAGLIGGRTGRSAMETVKMSFGQKGALFFAALNVLQLVGWTAIMIYDGALAADGVFAAGHWVWCLVMLCAVIFRGSGADFVTDESLSFGAAVELAVAMPLSWLPLISDYTRTAEKPFAATLASAVVYGLVSCWMYVIGMGAAIFAGESDLAQIILRSGLGAAGLLIIVLSTVTTTFLDAWSAGISSESLSSRLSGKWVAVGAAVIGTLGAMLFPMDDITDFLYLIGSVFAPMIAIQIADFFLLRQDRSGTAFDRRSALIWLAGFLLYRLLMRVDMFPKPTIAAVNGFALGGGCEMALACDIRVASEKAKFGQPEVGLGIIPGFGGTQRMARIIGTGPAMELIYTADTINAARALEIGMVNHVYAADELMDKALELANKICANAQVAIRTSKMAIRRGIDCDISTAVTYEALAFATCFGTEDQKDAMKAFVEKRKLDGFKNR